MRHVLKLSSVAFAVTGMLTFASIALAQSGSRSYPPSGSTVRTSPPAGSAQRTPEQAPLALDGYCPVSILEMKKWVKGNPAHKSVYDGKTYLFANEQGKRMFDSDQAKYVPALGGDCVVALVKMGKRVPGNLRHAAFHDNRLFLFSNEDAQKMFLAQPTAYANADLALNGQCPVCQVNMNQRVAGKPDIAAFHKGFRYLFPATEQRQTFLANPEKFVSAASQSSSGASGSGTRQPAPGSSPRPSVGSGSGSR